MNRWAALALAGGIGLSVAACASILGIEDGILDSVGEAGVPVCTTDSGVQVDTSQIFVAADIGDDSKGCGTDQAPCRTLAAAFAQLPKTPGAHLIYLSTGTYSETAHLPANVEIQGGWNARGTNPTIQWRQVCSPDDPVQAAIISGTENVTIRADAVGDAKLSKLSVTTRMAAPGESVYGLLASGASRLILEDVQINAGAAGAGSTGDAGINGETASGFCPSGSGLTPEAGAPGRSAGATTFSPNGFVSSPAERGDDGTAGGSGTIGTDGGCVACLNCVVAVNCNTSNGSSCGKFGLSGCGGQAGGGGAPGQTGGSSTGIFAWGGAVVIRVEAGKIQAGTGGNGGAGGAPGAGGEGSGGDAGVPGTSCNTACSAACAVGASATGAGNGGASGGKGGTGSAGGAGGAGAGGNSIAVYTGADASVELDGGTILVKGQAGSSGGPGAPPGIAAERFP